MPVIRGPTLRVLAFHGSFLSYGETDSPKEIIVAELERRGYATLTLRVVANVFGAFVSSSASPAAVTRMSAIERPWGFAGRASVPTYICAHGIIFFDDMPKEQQDDLERRIGAL